MHQLGEIRRRRGVTYYHQLYSLLAAALGDGTISPGSALPTESQLMDRFRLSRNTVRRALSRLEEEKRIIRRRGSGSYARSTGTPGVTADTIASILQNVAASLSQTTTRLLRLKSVQTPEHIRRRDPGFGATSLLVQRCRSYKSAPFLFSTSYVPERFAARLTRKTIGRKAVLIALDELGIVPASAEHTTTAVAADAVTARYLKTEPSSALLCLQRLVRDGDGHAIEHQTSLYRPDRCDLRTHHAIETSADGLRWTAAQPPPQAAVWL